MRKRNLDRRRHRQQYAAAEGGSDRQPGCQDQTTGDSTRRHQFPECRRLGAVVRRLDHRLAQAPTSITGGFGNDTIDGAGGADIINANAGDDTVTYRGTETSIDGGTGSDTLVLAATGGITAVNFSVAAGSDQTAGDSVLVANFENLDASVATTALTVLGSSGVNDITTGSGNDTIDGGGGADIIAAGAGNDTVSYRGTEFSIDGGTGTNTLLLRAATTVNLGSSDQTLGDLVTVDQLPERRCLAAHYGRHDHGIDRNQRHHRQRRRRHHRRRRRRRRRSAAGAGNDTVTYHGTEASIDGGAGPTRLSGGRRAASTAVNFAVAAGNDQTTGDIVGVTNFENLDASALSSALTVTGSTPPIPSPPAPATTPSMAAAASMSSPPAPATIPSSITAANSRSTAAPATTRW